MKTNDERLIDAIEKAIAIGIERVAAQDLRCGRTDRAVAAARLAGDAWDCQMIAKTLLKLVPLRRRA